MKKHPLSFLFIEKIKKFVKNHHLYILMFVGIVVGLKSLFWAHQNNYIVLYGDAKSHLNISRRVIDNINPGIVQLGGSWLPLFHILLIPLVSINFLYHTGLAGAIINFLAYLFSLYLLYKILLALTENKIIAFLSGIFYGLNSNVLYMQATAMTEIITNFFIFASIYYLISFVKKKKLSQLLMLAIIMFLGTLTRYEMWIFSIFSLLPITFSLINFKNEFLKSLKKTEGYLILYISLAFLGVGLWLIWNFLIFKDPIYFLHGQFSSKAYQMPLIEEGLNRTYKNMYNAFIYYFMATVNTNTWSVMILGMAGMLFFLFKKKSFYSLSFIFFCLSIFLFEIYSLYNGNTTIYIPQLFPYKYYNIRYGLYSLPVFIIFSFYLISIKKRLLTVLFILILTVETIFHLYKFSPITLVDPMQSYYMSGSRINAANYIKKHYAGGLILTTAGINDDIIHQTGLDMKSFITEGNQSYWNASLKQPQKYANWIILSKPNKFNEVRSDLSKKILNTMQLKDNFKLVFDEGDVLIYRKKNYK